MGVDITGKIIADYADGVVSIKIDVQRGKQYEEALISLELDQAEQLRDELTKAIAKAKNG